MWSKLGLLALATLKVSAVPGVVDLGYAKYRGLVNESLGIATFYGLPYAQAPIGNRRWRAPEAIEHAECPDEVINATAPGPICHQLYPPWALNTISVPAYAALSRGQAAPPSQPESEDCLRLDVVAPFKTAAKHSSGLPVVVAIHGGGYSIGNAEQMTPYGQFLVPFSNGSVIYVSIQYRLNVYGFLAGDAVQHEGTANAGLLDQRLALEWVQRHIANFGGDPDGVTIWGGSAGGGSVTHQMALYGGSDRSPPFHAAVAEFPWWQTMHDKEILNRQYSTLLAASKCSDLCCLRELNSTSLNKAINTTSLLLYKEGLYGSGDYFFGPAVDGRVIKDLPTKEFAAGHFSKVPIWLDHEGYEGVIFTNININQTSLKPSLEALWPSIKESHNGSAFYNGVMQHYPRPEFAKMNISKPPFSNYSSFAKEVHPTGIVDPPSFYQYQSILGDAFIDCPTYWVAKAVNQAGKTVHKLQFDASLEVHGNLQYFERYGQLGLKSAELLDRYLLNFVKMEDPNGHGPGGGEPVFPLWTPRSPKVLEYTQTSIRTVKDADINEMCEFLHSNAEIIRI